MSQRLLTCGEHAVLVEVDTLEEVLDLDLAVRAALEAGDPAFADVVDVVPAARTLLVVVRDGTEVMPVRSALTVLAPIKMSPTALSPAPPTATTVSSPTSTPRPLPPPDQSADRPQSAPLGGSGTGAPHVVEISVHYDGPDLDEVAGLTGLSVAEVVAAHTQTPWRVAFVGFAPGFAYLTGGDPRLQVPRRGEPRTSVPAGSVGLAGEFSAVYPRTSPGGWQLLGHTDAVLWDVDRQPPAMLRSGSLVRFVNADHDGSDRDGSDDDGSDREGSDRDGSDDDGSDHDGSDRDGSVRDGSVHDGPDHDGLDDDGSDHDGVASS